MEKISVIGLGFVGGSMLKSFQLKGCNVVGYDKFKKDTNTFEECLDTDVAFLDLPTVFDEETCEYDKSCIREVCTKLEENNYKGIVVIKSTVEPTTTIGLVEEFETLKFAYQKQIISRVRDWMQEGGIDPFCPKESVGHIPLGVLFKDQPDKYYYNAITTSELKDLRFYD